MLAINNKLSTILIKLGGRNRAIIIWLKIHVNHTF